MITRIAVAIGLVLAIGLVAIPPTPAQAAGCVRFVASNFDAPGNDNLASKLNGEWVRIKNVCNKRQAIGGWQIHDYRRYHVYRFRSGVALGPGKTITLHSGRGLDRAAHKYWGYSYGAVWNNTAPEYAYLRNGSGVLKSRWTEY